MKSDFDLIRSHIKSFMDFQKKYGKNKIVITDNDNKYELYSELIYLEGE